MYLYTGNICMNIHIAKLVDKSVGNPFSAVNCLGDP